MADIETRIKERSYQTPGRARAAISQSPSIKGKERTRLLELVDAWESEGVEEAVVGGVPTGEFEPPKPRKNGRRHPQMSGSIVGGDTVNGGGGTETPAGSIEYGKLANLPLLPASSALEKPITVNFNARIRARLTPYGVTLLYAARSKVAVPEDLMAKQGVWETVLWQFLLVVGDHLTTGDAAITEDSNFELLSLRA